MNVIVVSHPSRLLHVERLQRYLNVVAVVVDTVNALSGHRAALRLAAAHGERVVIMEDDAVPVEGFSELAQAWCDRYPEDLLSFYLGTSRPTYYQGLVDERLRIADLQGRDVLQLPTLIHGVCYSLPADGVAKVAENLYMREADFAVGAAWGRAVMYPLESLVQHRDEQPVERHPDGQPRNEPRVARRLAAPLMFNPKE